MADKNTEVSFSINAFDNKLQIAIVHVLYIDHKCYKKIRKIILLNVHYIQIIKKNLIIYINVHYIQIIKSIAEF